MSLFEESIIYFAAAIVMVPLFKRIGLGSILGYLAAGILIGPAGFALIGNVEHTLHFAEFGVVLLLFIIGLELQPSRLWALKKPIFLLGGLQLFASCVLIFLVAILLGIDKPTALLIGLALSLSSTAFALQLLSEKEQLAMRHGRASFAILLFQDIAVIPILILIPLLAGVNAAQGNVGFAIAKVTSVAIAVIVIGRFLIRPFLRFMVSTKVHEMMTVSALFIVIGTALIMDYVGLSMALGAFFAGVLLADSEYRHELEANIEPFKGLLLGLFFIAVGMSVDIGILFAKPLLVIALVLGLMLLKAAVLFTLGRFNQQNSSSSLSLAATLLQGGEFAFVIFSAATSVDLLSQALSDLLIVVVSLSMALTPLVFALHENIFKPRLQHKQEPEFDTIENENSPVILVGFGRFGQIIARILSVKSIPFTALEVNFNQVDFVRRFGNKIYYGDARRLDLLRAAGADSAKIIVLTLKHDIEHSVEIVEMVKKHFPHLEIYACTRNRAHTFRLMKAGVKHIIRETILSSLSLSGSVLQGLGVSKEEADNIVQKFKEHDEKLLIEQFAIHQDKDKLVQSVQKSADDLRRLFEDDQLVDKSIDKPGQNDN